jgi:hypothetical protein
MRYFNSKVSGAIQFNIYLFGFPGEAHPCVDVYLYSWGTMIVDCEIREVEVETKALLAYKRRQNGRFLKGPTPMWQNALASQQPGQALPIFLAIHHRSARPEPSTVERPQLPRKRT